MLAVICLVRTVLPANPRLVTVVTRPSLFPCSFGLDPNSSRLPQICSRTAVTMQRLLCCVNLWRSSISLGRLRRKTKKASVGFAARVPIGSSSLLRPSSEPPLANAFGVRTTVTIASSAGIQSQAQGCCSGMTPSWQSYSFLTSWVTPDESGIMSCRGLRAIHTANTFTCSTRKWRSDTPNGRPLISWSTYPHRHEPRTRQGHEARELPNPRMHRTAGFAVRTVKRLGVRRLEQRHMRAKSASGGWQ